MAADRDPAPQPSRPTIIGGPRSGRPRKPIRAFDYALAFAPTLKAAPCSRKEIDNPSFRQKKGACPTLLAESGAGAALACRSRRANRLVDGGHPTAVLPPGGLGRANHGRTLLAVADPRHPVCPDARGGNDVLPPRRPRP